MSFADQLKSERRRLGLNQAEAAKACDEPIRTWADWERGKTTPKPCHQEGILARLAKMQPPGDSQNVESSHGDRTETSNKG